MYYLDSRWRRQSLVYFGEPQDLNVAAGVSTYVPWPLLSNSWSRRITRMNSEFGQSIFSAIEAAHL